MFRPSNGVGGGVCVWLTGRSGAGKTTLVRAFIPLLEANDRAYTLLDTVPALAKHWSERSSENKLMRKAYVASEVVRHGGIAICVTVSAREDVRAAARALVGSENFVEVFVDTPPEVAAARKAGRGRRTPLAKRLRAGLRRAIRRGTGSDASYDVPASPDVTVDGSKSAPDDCARQVFDVLVARGFIVPAQLSSAILI